MAARKVQRHQEAETVMAKVANRNLKLIFIKHDEKEHTMKKRHTLSITLILSLLLGLFTTGMAFASEGNEVEVEGTIVALYPGEFYLEVEAEVEGEMVILEVEVGQNFNFDAYDEGDLLELKGTLNEEGRLVVTELKIQERARDRVMTQDGELESYYCDVAEQEHPIAAKIADSYGIDYDVIEGYLCAEEKVPLGKLMLALQTEAISDYTLDELLFGEWPVKWGQIWQTIDLKGKPDHGTAPGKIQNQDGENDPAGDGNDQGANKSGKQ
jgi:hypothetical protein